MNFEILESIVDLIEEDYNKEITKDSIERVTQKSYGYSRNEFKKIINMPLDKYRIRRQLSIIINNIKNTKSKLSEFNLEPWSGENSFYKAFLNEFGIPPMKFIKEYDESILQPKINVDCYKNKFKEEGELIEKLVRTYGNKENALKYLLTLEPYIFVEEELNSVDSKENLEEILIRYKYETYIGNKLFCGDIPGAFYESHRKSLNKYYDLDIKNYFEHNKYFDSGVEQRGYIKIKRSVINELMKEIDIINLLGEKVAPSMLRTIWHGEIKAKHFDRREFSWGEFGDLSFAIIHRILRQDVGPERIDTMEDLRRDIEFDYDKFIDRRNELCIKCGYRETCQDDDECRYFEELSKEEQEDWESKPDYELLSMGKLLSEVKGLLLKGLLYLDKQIIID